MTKRPLPEPCAIESLIDHADPRKKGFVSEELVAEARQELALLLAFRSAWILRGLPTFHGVPMDMRKFGR